MGRFYFGGRAFSVPDTVYYPREDSLLLARVLAHTPLADKTVLDMGCGSGFLSIVAALRGAAVTACDSNPDAVDATLRNAQAHGVLLKVVQSDLFSAITNTFDVIISNPPYLPEADKPANDEERQWHGGPGGRAFINRFIRSAGEYLAPGGRIFLLISSLNSEEKVTGHFSQNGFAARPVMREKVPWEELIVLEAREHQPAAPG